MRKKRYDVVVVGCGPGGAIAGKFAALNGAETLVIELKRQIGFPIYDNMAIIFSQSEMEETTGEKIEPATIFSKAEGLAYISPGGKQGKPVYLADGIFINRQLFEKSLAIGAIRAGAEIMLHTRVVNLVKEQGVVKGVVIKDGSGLTPILCSAVIVAEGSYQHIARLAGFEFPSGIPSTSFGCEFAGVKPLRGLPNIDQIYLDASGENAYQVVVPYGGDRVCAHNAWHPSPGKQKKSLKQRLDDHIRRLEALGMYDFSKASPVIMKSGGGPIPSELVVDPKLASDGIILVGNAAGGPMWGSRWGGIGVMLGACWTGQIAGELAAKAVKKGDVNGRTLDEQYKHIIDDSFKGEKNRIVEASDARKQILALSHEEQDKAIEEIGQEVAALHIYARGALNLRSCLEPVQKWLKEFKRG